jgi:hypothetical protein
MPILGNPHQSGNNTLDFVNRTSSYYDHIIVQQKQLPGSFLHLNIESDLLQTTYYNSSGKHTEN